MDKSSPNLINLSILQIISVLLVTFLYWASLSSTMALTSGSETDRLALLALKDQLTNSISGALSSWNASFNFCEWQGVGCGKRHQRVTALRLDGLNLAGSISPSIGNLTFLREVNLTKNRLRGNIPSEFGHLRRLQSLALRSNYLQGKIPIELTNCSDLQSLILNVNNLTGEIPFQFGHMLKLRILLLGDNNLTGGIPPFLANVSSLSILELSANHFHGSIPHFMSGMSSLRSLLLFVTGLSGMITPLYNLSSLEYLDLGGNNFSGSLIPNIDLAFPNAVGLYFAYNYFTGTIPTSISNISSMQQLEIIENFFEGSVPNTLGKLKYLQMLNIAANNLGSGKAGDLSFLTSLTNCSHLNFLTIYMNRFGGELPQSVANLSTHLRELYMGRNQISGSIPERIGDLSGLTILELDENFLVGVIPASIAKLKNLGRLFLSINNLSGNIPSFIGNLSQLFDLYLDTNNFEGSIPLTLRNCTNLQNLYLSHNNLSGNIPDQVFGFCESLIVVNISYNSLNGPVPSDFGNLKNLVTLNVSENKFSGEIPASLGECSELSILDLGGNLFLGSIPLSLSYLKSLEILNLSHNSLSGTIPQQLQKLSFLKSLNLSFNHLEGEVPTGGVFKDANAFSIIGNNKLCGGVPEIRLPVCLNLEPRKKPHSLSTKVTVAIILCVLFSTTIVVVLLILCWRRKCGKQLGPTSIVGGSFLRISYKELLQATDDFASHNLIGAGSSGTVYIGSIQQLEKPVAIKVLNLQNRGASKSFMAECKALSKVRHRNLLKIITSCSSLDYKGNDFKALVFEFMPNGSLERWLHTTEQLGLRNLNLMQRLDIAIDVAYALDYLHHHCENPIVHCDLKPTNILLDDDMIAHVGDFGLAKLLCGNSVDFSRDQTTSSGVKGTIGYVPPEYGMGAIVSPEGDVYSYGILLLEMITGKRPTDEMFNEGLSLHEFCKMALPERVRDITDSHLLGLLDANISSAGNGCLVEDNMLECLVSFGRIGVACSAESPGERMNIEDVISELQATKTRMLQAATQGRNVNEALSSS